MKFPSYFRAFFKLKLQALFCILFIVNSVFAQQVEGVDLASYPAASVSIASKKAIRWETNPFRSKVKEIKDGYSLGEINFAGFYVVTLWKKGRDTIQGVMVDSRTGRIYRLPIQSTNTYNRCGDIEDIFDRYLFLPASRMFVTSTCKLTNEQNEKRTLQFFYFYVWDEASKKFSLLKKVRKERKL